MSQLEDGSTGSNGPGEVVKGPERDQDNVELLNEGGNDPNPRVDANLGRTSDDGLNEEEVPAKKQCFDLVKLSKEADKHKWELPDELAAHFTEHTKIHFSDNDWKVNMEAYPVPSNVGCVPVMDNNLKGLLKEEGQNTAIDMDHELSNIQSKVQEIMGPLGKAWSECLQFKRGDFKEIDVYSITDSLNMATVAVAHAMQKITYYRRLSSLSSLGNMKSARETLKEEKVQKIFSEDASNVLFPKEFDDLLKAQKGSRSNILATFKPAALKKKKENILPRSSSSGSSGKSSSGSKD